MHREQEKLQFLGFFGICKESINIIFSWGKIFSKITLTLILPLSCIFLAHSGISIFLRSKILTNEATLNNTPVGSPTFNRVSNLLSLEWTAYWLFKLVYFTFLLVFPLLSTSAVVYTIAYIHTGKEITFKKVMSVVPEVWKRLAVTFLWSFGIIFAYNLAWIIIVAPFIFCILLAQVHWSFSTWLVIGKIFWVLYMVGVVYINVIWQLASVISVMEDSYGIQAMRRSKGLVNGKMGIASIICFLFYLCLVGIQRLFDQSVVFGARVGGKIGYGFLCLVLLTFLFLFVLVVQTIIYFVCKSNHHENINRSSFADHLEVYHGDYNPLNAKNIQLEQFQV